MVHDMSIRISIIPILPGCSLLWYFARGENKADFLPSYTGNCGKVVSIACLQT